MFSFHIDNAQDANDFLSAIYSAQTLAALSPDSQLSLARVEASAFPAVVKAALRARAFGHNDEAERIRAAAPQLFTRERLQRYREVAVMGLGSNADGTQGADQEGDALVAHFESLLSAAMH